MASSHKEQVLLRSLHAWDTAWANKDAQALRKCLTSDTKLHADGVLFEHDVCGADAIVAVHTHYFERFDYKHNEIAHAVNPATNAAFGFWEDSSVTRRGRSAEGETGAHHHHQHYAILGIWQLIFNEEGSQVKEIYFLRQLHPEEAEHKLRDPSKAFHGGIDAKCFAGQTAMDNTLRKDASRRAAERYSEMWQGQGDNDAIAAEVLTDGFQEFDLTKGRSLQGRQAFVDMIKKMTDSRTGWVSESSSLDIGVAPDRTTALIHWTSVGHMGKDQPRIQQFGLSVMVLDPQNPGTICCAAGFRQPTCKEREEMLRPDAFAHAAQKA